MQINDYAARGGRALPFPEYRVLWRSRQIGVNPGPFGDREIWLMNTAGGDDAGSAAAR